MKYVITAILFLAIGIWCGYKLHKPIVETRYEHLPAIEITKSNLRPISADLQKFIYIEGPRTAQHEISKPEESLVPINVDSINSPYAETIIAFNESRSYVDTVFCSDTLGRAVLFATVQYNTLSSYSLEFNPVMKHSVTTLQKPKLEGYGIAGFTTRDASIAVGVKYGKLGLHGIVGYDYIGKTPSYGVGILFTF